MVALQLTWVGLEASLLEGSEMGLVILVSQETLFCQGGS